ncbi:hypothetical protein [Clostridium perfringens]|uniref:hypothetical protein n=1 Tax=Clostridium perfringens TaxID=1502 RepID=UPI0013E28AE2|nr:hypothetical protein [Clostridium perfringens]MBO3312827.1 hypothetical protein [Clostridium perfringens]NGT03596.1 hypothetical protein [Clostridium perfringens]
MAKKKFEPVEIDYSKLRRSSAKTKNPVYFAVSEEELARRMARQWERTQKLKEEKRLREKCLLQEGK